MTSTVDLALFPVLRKLTLALSFTTQPSSALYGVLYSLLASLSVQQISAESHPLLRNLTITIPPNFFATFDRSNNRQSRDKVATSLGGVVERIFVDVIEQCKLERIDFNCYTTGSRADTEALLRKIFPMLNTLGLICVRVTQGGDERSCECPFSRS